jgi:hypothetical protein
VVDGRLVVARAEEAVSDLFVDAGGQEGPEEVEGLPTDASQGLDGLRVLAVIHQDQSVDELPVGDDVANACEVRSVRRKNVCEKEK